MYKHGNTYRTTQLQFGQKMFFKVSTQSKDFDWRRQSPKNGGLWNGCIFNFNQKTTMTDYWIVLEDLMDQETSICNQEGAILITGEPPSVKKYHQKFLNQFSTVITCHEQIKHKNKILLQQGLHWFIGKTYDELTETENFSKEKLISVISSKKSFTKGHRDRVIFVEKLEKHFGSKIDIYGRGFNEVVDKWGAIAPYKYHIVLENSSFAYYWTEKIADAYLGHSYPIYFGCPNLSHYFPENSFSQIDINRPEEAISTIEKVIEENFYEKSISAIKQAKYLVLNKYNLFPYMSELCKENNFVKKEITLYPQEYFYKNDPIIKKAYRKFRFFLQI